MLPPLLGATHKRWRGISFSGFSFSVPDSARSSFPFANPQTKVTNSSLSEETFFFFTTMHRLLLFKSVFFHSFHPFFYLRFRLLALGE